MEPCQGRHCHVHSSSQPSRPTQPPAICSGGGDLRSPPSPPIAPLGHRLLPKSSPGHSGDSRLQKSQSTATELPSSRLSKTSTEKGASRIILKPLFPLRGTADGLTLTHICQISSPPPIEYPSLACLQLFLQSGGQADKTYQLPHAARKTLKLSMRRTVLPHHFGLLTWSPRKKSRSRTGKRFLFQIETT